MPSDLFLPGPQEGRACWRAHRGWEEGKRGLWERCGGRGRQGRRRHFLSCIHPSFRFCSFASVSEFDFMPSTPSKVYAGSLNTHRFSLFFHSNSTKFTQLPSKSRNYAENWNLRENKACTSCSRNPQFNEEVPPRCTLFPGL